MKGGSSTSERQPRAVIHRRILDEAEANPDASIEGLAESVSGASADLVEEVLETYGDPAEGEADDQTETTPMSSPESPNPEDLSEEQREILEAIDRHPEATQAELADELGVSTATVNKRVNAIDGFEWSERVEFARRLLPSETASDGGSTANEGSIDDLRDRVGRLEKRIGDGSEGQDAPFDDPEIVAKVVRACVDAESITEEEEVQVIETLMGERDDA